MSRARTSSPASIPDPGADRRRSAWIRRLSLGIAAASCAEFVIATTGVQIHVLPPRTDFATYYLAGTMARERRSPYDHTALAEKGRALGFRYEQVPYLYPPAFALAMQPFASLPLLRARQVWMVLETAVTLAAVAVSVLLVRDEIAALELVQPALFWVIVAAFVPAALNSASVQNDLRLGSVGAWLWLGCAAAGWGLLRRREVLTGAALALATMVKLVPALLLAYAWWRGTWRAAAIGVGLLALSTVPAVVHWGPGILRDYWSGGLLPTLHLQAGWATNQSLDAFLLRLFDPSALEAFPAGAPWAKTLLSVLLSAAILIATLAVVVRHPRATALLPLELGYVLLALLIVMKVTWVYTLAAMLFVWPVLVAVLVRVAELGASWAVPAGVVGSVGFFFSSAQLPILWTARLHHGPWVLLTGAHLAGIVVLWAATGFTLRRAGPGLRDDTLDSVHTGSGSPLH